jgi:hypothetical protein
MAHMYQHPDHPFRPAWDALEAETRGRGLVHGGRALTILQSVRPDSGSADSAMLLAAMVREGILRPVAKDLAGASHSVKAFRGLQHLRETKPARNPDVGQWLDGIPCEAADAHLWTFEIA